MIDTSEFNNLLDVINAFDTEQKCIDHLTTLRWDGYIVSPFDPSSKIYVCKGNKYKCKNTGKYFNVKTNTMFDNTKVKLQKWFIAIYLVTSHKKGISSIQLGKDIGVTQKTAWFMLHRIRACFGLDSDNNDKLSNEVEIDETFVGGKAKNKQKRKNPKKSQGRSGVKSVVLGMVERNGKVIAKKIKNNSNAEILPVIYDRVSKGATVYTDEFRVYRNLRTDYNQHAIRHRIRQYVDGRIHTNTIEEFWSLLKRSIIGIYHYVSPKHLQNYVDESTFRYNTRLLNEAERMNHLFCNIEVRTTYKSLING